MVGGGEAGHVEPDLGGDHAGGDGIDAGDLAQPRDRLGIRGDLGAVSGVQGGDVRIDGVDTAERLREQEGVVVGEVTGERLLQRSEFGAQPAAGVLGQCLGVALAGELMWALQQRALERWNSCPCPRRREQVVSPQTRTPGGPWSRPVDAVRWDRARVTASPLTDSSPRS